MKHIVEFKDWTPEPAVNQLLQAEIDRIQRLVKGLRTESLALWVVVDRNEPRTLYRVTIRMELPGPDVSASEERHDLKEAVHDAFAEVRRQIEKHRRKLTHTTNTSAARGGTGYDGSARVSNLPGKRGRAVDVEQYRRRLLELERQLAERLGDERETARDECDDQSSACDVASTSSRKNISR